MALHVMLPSCCHCPSCHAVVAMSLSVSVAQPVPPCLGQFIRTLSSASENSCRRRGVAGLRLNIKEFTAGLWGGGGGGVTHSLLSSEDPHSVWLCGLATNIVGSSVCVWGGGGGS